MERGPPRFAQRHDPFLAALARHHQESRVTARRSERQSDQLRYSEASCIKQLDHAAEPNAFLSGPALRRVDHCLDLAFGHSTR